MDTWSPEQLWRLTIAEVSRRRVAVITCFVVVSLASLLLGAVMPKSYSSAATVLAERREILSPLLEGSAVGSAERVNDQDRLRFYRELLFSRNIVLRVIEETGLINVDNKNVALEEQVIRDVIDQTTLEATGPNLVRITVEDAMPDHAYELAQLFSELLVSESESEKTRESSEAFDFIGGQAREYHGKLVDAEQRLTEHRASNVDIGQGTEAAVSARISGLQADVERSRLELREARTRVNSLEAQLSGESQVVVRETRVSQYRSQIASLQQEIDVLRLRYTDTYPDIVNLKYQITDLEKALRREIDSTERISTGEDARSSAAMANPLWQRLRQSLSDAKTEVATLDARLYENQRLLEIELERAKRIPQIEATLAELTRDYEVNNTVYQDLLRRRENARVSMNMDLQQRGGNFRVLYAANYPVVPDGLRLLHFAIIGPLLGILIPLILIVSFLQFDPRIRHEEQIRDILAFEVVEVGTVLTRQEEARNRFVTMALGTGMFTVFVVYAYLGWLSVARILAGA